MGSKDSFGISPIPIIFAIWRLKVVDRSMWAF